MDLTWALNVGVDFSLRELWEGRGAEPVQDGTDLGGG